MSGSAFVRMRDEYAVAFIFATFLSFFLAFIPNYQKYAYRDATPIPYSPMMKTASVGYPAAENFPTVGSVEDIESAKDTYFTIEIDRADLTPMDLYVYLEKRTFSTNGFMRIINNNDFGGAGRLFVAKLKSGEKVIVLLDDTTIELPKKGVVKLPIGKSVKVNTDEIKGLLKDKSGLTNVESYIDMAGNWRECEEAKKIENIRYVIGIVVFIGSWIAFSIWLTKLFKEEEGK